MSKNSSDKKIDEPSILEEKDDQMETEKTIKLTEEERKAKLLKDIKFDETKIEKLEPYEEKDILRLTDNQWKEKFGVDEGILYFNRISELKVKTILIKKIGRRKKPWSQKKTRRI